MTPEEFPALLRYLEEVGYVRANDETAEASDWAWHLPNTDFGVILIPTSGGNCTHLIQWWHGQREFDATPCGRLSLEHVKTAINRYTLNFLWS